MGAVQCGVGDLPATIQGKEVLTKARETRRTELGQSLGETLLNDMVGSLGRLLEGLVATL